MNANRANGNFLFETVICDLHSTALQVGCIAVVVAACSKSDAGWTLRAWRHGLFDDCEAMRLALRFRDQIGLNTTITAKSRDYTIT